MTVSHPCSFNCFINFLGEYNRWFTSFTSYCTTYLSLVIYTQLVIQ